MIVAIGLLHHQRGSGLHHLHVAGTKDDNRRHLGGYILHMNSDALHHPVPEEATGHALVRLLAGKNGSTLIP